MLQIVIKRSLKFQFLQDITTRKNGFPVFKAYFHIYHYIKKTLKKKEVTKIYTKKLKQGYKIKAFKRRK